MSEKIAMLFGHSILPGANDRTWPHCDIRDQLKPTDTGR
jgi:hypothetical protein